MLVDVIGTSGWPRSLFSHFVFVAALFSHLHEFSVRNLDYKPFLPFFWSHFKAKNSFTRISHTFEGRYGGQASAIGILGRTYADMLPQPARAFPPASRMEVLTGPAGDRMNALMRPLGLGGGVGLGTSAKEELGSLLAAFRAHAASLASTRFGGSPQPANGGAPDAMAGQEWGCANEPLRSMAYPPP